MIIIIIVHKDHYIKRNYYKLNNYAQNINYSTYAVDDQKTSTKQDTFESREDVKNYSNPMAVSLHVSL